MVLTLTQFLEAFFVAIMIVLLTSPQLIPSIQSGQSLLQLVHFF